MEMTAHDMGLARNGRPALNFWRHFGEMFLAMVIGMIVSGAAVVLIAAILGIPLAEANDRLPVLHMFLMTLGMTLPMTAWMRYRRHGWRSTIEMSAAMFLPGLVFTGLVAFGAMSWGPACGLYCALLMPGMLIPMWLRKDEYTQDHRYHMAGHQH